MCSVLVLSVGWDLFLTEEKGLKAANTRVSIPPYMASFGY